MNLHCIGDSHCSFFLGYNAIKSEYPSIGNSLLKNTFCYWLGPSLAYNINKYNSTTKSREKIEAIIAGLDPLADIVLLCFGEIDCRAHILKQAEATKTGYEQIVEKCLSNYQEMIEYVRAKGFTVIVWNAIYSSNYMEKAENLEYPYFGTVHDRNKVTAEFNNQLKRKATELSAKFLDVTSLLVDNKTGLTNDQYYYDEIHMNNKLFVPVIKQLNSFFAKPVFTGNQLLVYKIKLFRQLAFDFMRRSFVLRLVAKKTKAVLSKKGYQFL
jgi:hypothetical protein